jgi:hypothetical protein
MAIKDNDTSPDGMAIAALGLATSLLDELRFTDNQRAEIIGRARSGIASWGSGRPFAEARAFLNMIEDKLPKSR